MLEQNGLRVFISYRREKGGVAYAHILNEQLSSLGISCFFDIRSMHDFSKDFEIEIEKNIRISDYVIILLQNGSLTEREHTDYFFKEIRFSKELGKKLLLLPIGNGFSWEAQQDVPEDVVYLKKMNLCMPLQVENLSESIYALIGMMKEDKRNLHYLMLLKMRSSTAGKAPILQKTSDIYNVDISERWANATRVSLLAVGCSSVVQRFSPLIKAKALSGTKFRFLAIDPNGDSARDFSQNKLNGNAGQSRKDFINQNYYQMVTIFQNIQMDMSNLEYRLTDDHITFTMHWVECEDDSESYIYVEYIPIHASEILQDTHCAVLIKRNDSAYNFYAGQFELCWEKSRLGIENKALKNCEFCYPPSEDDKYILCDTTYWRIYFANNQNYPGRCIIPLRRHCANLSEITKSEMEDFYGIVRMLEKIWREELSVTNFNWTCLMNGGYAEKPYIPHVHFHMIPRYDAPFTTSDGEFVDSCFGNHYELSDAYQLNDADRMLLCERLKKKIAEYQKS